MNAVARSTAMMCALLAVLFAGSLNAQPPADEASAVGVELLWSRQYRLDDIRSETENRSAPAFGERHLFLATGDRVLAIDLATGFPAWPSGRDNDDGAIFRMRPTQMPRVEVGPRFGAATLADGRLIAVTGLGGARQQASMTSAVPELSAFDIQNGEGKLLWSIGIDHALARQGWMPAGAPAVVSGRVWFSVRGREKPTELALAHVSLLDGADVRLVPLPADGAEALPGRARTAFLEALDHSIVAVDSTGAVAALSRDVGTVRWSFSNGGKYARPENAQATILSRPVSDRQLVFTASPSGRVLAFDAVTGAIRWESNLGEDSLQLAAATSETLFAAGRSLWALDAKRGMPRWKFGFPDAVGAGQAAVFGRYVAWTTREELFVLETATGAVVERLSLKDRFGLAGGDVYAAGGKLVLVSADRVSVFRGLAR